MEDFKQLEGYIILVDKYIDLPFDTYTFEDVLG